MQLWHATELNYNTLNTLTQLNGNAVCKQNSAHKCHGAPLKYDH